MTAAAAAAAGQAFLRDRRPVGAVVAAVLLHGLLFWQARTPVSGDRLLEPATAMSVRMVGAPAVALASAAPVAMEASADAMPVPAPAPPPAPEPAVRTVDPVPAIASPRTAEPLPPSPPVPAEIAPPTPGPASPPVPAGLPDAPDYAFAARLDPGPQPLGDIQPEYPEGAELRSGTVVLRILVSETGRVDNVAVVRAQPPGVFDKAAVTAFEAARFAPGRLLGMPVKSQMTVEVAFTPLNRGPRVSGRGY